MDDSTGTAAGDGRRPLPPASLGLLEMEGGAGIFSVFSLETEPKGPAQRELRRFSVFCIVVACVVAAGMVLTCVALALDGRAAAVVSQFAHDVKTAADRIAGRGTAAEAATVEVSGPGGTFVGVHNATSSLDFFLGVPYARPPVGPLRWRPPQPLGVEPAVVDATSFEACCLQSPERGGELSEDCLYLNVARPAWARADSELPVVVWVHGGDYARGCGNDAMADTMASRSPLPHAGDGVILVTISYRLGIFGFLGADALRVRSSDGGTGNFGLLDQQMALHWVQDHIEPFGGDPERVTLAGGNSVLHHLVMPASYHHFSFTGGLEGDHAPLRRPLYSRAAVQSGAQDASVSGAEAAAVFGAVLERARATFPRYFYPSGDDVDTPTPQWVVGAAPLLELSGAELLSIARAGGAAGAVGPVVDGVALTASPIELIARGDFNTEVPVMVTSARDETAAAMLPSSSRRGDPGASSPLDWTGLLGAAAIDGGGSVGGPGFPGLSASQDELTDELRDAYRFSGGYPYPDRLGGFSHAWWAAMRAATDRVPDGRGRCAARHLVDLLAEGGAMAAYEALFARPLEDFCGARPKPGRPSDCSAFDGVLAPRGVDEAYLFGTAAGFGERETVSIVQTFWARFAATGDPNAFATGVDPSEDHGGLPVRRLPTWVDREPGGPDALMSFGGTAEGGVRVMFDVRAEACDVQERVAHVAFGYPLTMARASRGAQE